MFQGTHEPSRMCEAEFTTNGELTKLYIIYLHGQLRSNVPGSIHYNLHDGAWDEITTTPSR